MKQFKYQPIISQVCTTNARVIFQLPIFQTRECVCLSCWCHVLETEQVSCLLLMIAIIFVTRVPELDLTLLAAICESPNNVRRLPKNRSTSYSQYDIEQRPHFMRGFGASEADIPQ